MSDDEVGRLQGKLVDDVRELAVHHAKEHGLDISMEALNLTANLLTLVLVLDPTGQAAHGVRDKAVRQAAKMLSLRKLRNAAPAGNA